MRNKYIPSVVLASMALCCSSCSDWLDVNPKSQVKEEALFSKETGFQDALLGIYSTMGEHETYGGHSTMGLMEILAQTYSDVYSNSNMDDAMEYKYDDETVKGCIDDQWRGLYKAVANCNYLLKNVEENGSVMTDKVRRIVKGEAMTARAYLLFDAMRAYAPSYTVGKDADAVPFVDHVTNAPVAPLTVAETTDKLIADVIAARELVKDVDPIGPAFETYSEEAEYDANDYALDNGYCIAWGGDVSEEGFTRNGLAYAIDSKKAQSLAGSDMARWLKLSKSEKTSKLDSLGCLVPEITPTQEMRQERYDSWELTDDHGMLIYGKAKDQHGKEYYMVKNSWGEAGDYTGIWYMTKTFIAANTMDYMVN